MAEPLRALLGAAVLGARVELDTHVNPRDDFERAVINALGDISWDEAVEAIKKHRAGPSASPPQEKS